MCWTHWFHHATGLVPTYQRGSYHIYGMYTSITLQVSGSGYLLFGIIPSDHHLLWLKIEFDSVFGVKMDTLVSHTARRVNFKKPDNIKRFIVLYKIFIRENDLHLEFLYLQESMVRKPFRNHSQKIYDRLLKKSEMGYHRHNQNARNWRCRRSPGSGSCKRS